MSWRVRNEGPAREDSSISPAPVQYIASNNEIEALSTYVQNRKFGYPWITTRVQCTREQFLSSKILIISTTENKGKRIKVKRLISKEIE